MVTYQSAQRRQPRGGASLGILGVTTRKSLSIRFPGPRLPRVLATLAFHVTSVYAEDVPRGKAVRGSCGILADPEDTGSLGAWVRWEISRLADAHAEPVWDTCYIHDDAGPQWVGNRCGLRDAIVAAYAPIVAEAARLDAADAAARSAA